MDIETQFDGIRDKIQEDYGILDNSVEYVATVVLCWGNKKYREQKEVVKDFMDLQERGLIPWYVTIEDIKAWMISRDQNIVKERFQREDSDRKDELIYLTWGVNIRLKLQEIVSYASGASKRAGGSQRPAPPRGPQRPAGQDPHLAALADLHLGNDGVVPPGGFTLHYHYFYSKYPPRFDARVIVQRAVKDIMHELACPPTSCPQALPDVVVDTVACLFQVIMDEGGADGGGGATDEMKMRLLSGMAVGTVISVLCQVRADARLTVEFPRATRARVVARVHAELQRNEGSAQALKGALCARETRTAAAIATAVTAEMRRLCHAAHTSPSTDMALLALGEEAVTGATATEEAKSAEKQDDTAEPLLDNLGTADPQVDVVEERKMEDAETRDTAAISTAINTAFASAGMTVMQLVGDAIAGETESKEVELSERQDDEAEPPLDDLGTAAPQVDVIAERKMEDACAVDEQKGPKGHAEGDGQPDDCPQMRGRQSAVWRFLGRLWTALKSYLCCYRVSEG